MKLSATIIILLFLFGGLIILFLLMIRDTFRRKGIWGVNLRKVRCPRCGEQLPMVRTPASFDQAVWGGWTCSKCACKIDKWGIEIPQVKTSFPIPLSLGTKDQIHSEGRYLETRTPLEKVIGEK